MLRLRILLPLILLTSTAFSASPTWVEIRSKNFSVLTDAGEKRGQEVARRFEEVRSAFGTIFQKMNSNSPIPLQIIAFRNNKELQPYGPMWKGKPVEVDGFFQGSKDKNFVVLDLSSDGGWHVVFHEYMHLLINTNMPPAPAWFDEGFADYFSTLTVSAKTIEFGIFPVGYPQLLSNSRWMPSTELFAVKRNSSEYNEGDRRTVFYAQSWLTIHYLMSQHKLPEIMKYLDLTSNQHLGVAEAIQQAFGMPADEFDKALRNYFMGRTLVFRVAAPPTLERGPFEAKVADPMLVEASLADLHAHELDHMAEGLDEFRRIAAKDPNNLIAQRGLAYWYLQKNDYEHAAEHLERAAASDAADPEIHYFNAMVISERGGDAAKVRAELRKAVQLNPSYADALTMLGVMEAQSGDKKEALKYATRAVELGPRDDNYLANLVFVQLQNELYDDVEPSLELLARSQNLAIAENAEKNLLELREMKRRRREEAEVKSAEKSVESDNGLSDTESSPTIRAKGMLTAVECDENSATLHINASSGKVLNLKVNDIKHVVVVNADKFSCDWRDRPVSVSYFPETHVVTSVEVR